MSYPLEIKTLKLGSCAIHFKVSEALIFFMISNLNQSFNVLLCSFNAYFSFIRGFLAYSAILFLVRNVEKHYDNTIPSIFLDMHGIKTGPMWKIKEN